MQTVVGWVLLGGGIASIATVKSNQSTLESRLSRTGLGLLAIICSIPFFIIANHNKTKANAVTAYFKLQELAPSRMVYQQVKYVPGVSVRLKL